MGVGDGCTRSQYEWIATLKVYERYSAQGWRRSKLAVSGPSTMVVANPGPAVGPSHVRRNRARLNFHFFLLLIITVPLLSPKYSHSFGHLVSYLDITIRSILLPYILPLLSSYKRRMSFAKLDI